MRRIEYFELIIGLFKFKTVLDEQGNEFVLFAHSKCDSIKNIKDRTEFEAVENHVHLIDNLKKDEFDKFIPIVKDLGITLLNILQLQYPCKQFIVFISLHVNDSVIIRFHQKWKNEIPYYNPFDFKSDRERVFAFETEHSGRYDFS